MLKAASSGILWIGGVFDESLFRCGEAGQAFEFAVGIAQPDTYALAFHDAKRRALVGVAVVDGGPEAAAEVVDPGHGRRVQAAEVDDPGTDRLEAGFGVGIVEGFEVITALGSDTVLPVKRNQPETGRHS